MIHRLSKTASALLLVCGIALLCWLPLSYMFTLSGEIPLPQPRYLLVSSVRDVLVLQVLDDSMTSSHAFSMTLGRISELEQDFGPSVSTDMTFRPKAFQWSRFASPNGRWSMAEVAVPVWLLALLALCWPATRRVARHYRLRRAGHCPRCGYDLTGNVSGVCPECGSSVPFVDASPRG